MNTETKQTPPHTEQWFQIQYSRTGADDWYDLGRNHATLKSAAHAFPATIPDLDFEYRIVRKVLSETVCDLKSEKNELATVDLKYEVRS